ncbi:MAG: hypothetical protein HZB68_04325 [Candidatus Aenigmarchaeota archaeon]|nr:hypothetical protein [Candidatus Aenigmarchaeota archaeon]
MINAIKELQKELFQEKTRLNSLLSEGKVIELHMELNYLASLVGKRHSMGISINFPERDFMDEIIRGERNIIIVTRPFRNAFLGNLSAIREKAASFFPNSCVKNFDNGEGFHILFEGGKVSMFPGSVHLWCNVKKAERFLAWAMENVYW